MPVTSNSPGPYAPASAVSAAIERHRARGLPTPIDTETLARIGISDSLIPRTLQSLQTLDLITPEGKPTEIFEELRLAPEAQYKDRLQQWLNLAYADVVKIIDPRTATQTEIEDAFRTYKPQGMRDRMASLFIKLYSLAGVRDASETSAPRKLVRPPLRPLAKGSAPSSTPKPVKAVFTRDAAPTLPPQPPAKQDYASLEYKLVDLLKNNDMDDDQRNAVWTLIQYLSAKERN